MSAFGDWWVKTRNAVEADVLAALTAIEPEAKAVLVTAVNVGLAAAAAKGGTVGDQFVAARDATVQSLAGSGQKIATDLIHAVVAGAVSSPAT